MNLGPCKDCGRPMVGKRCYKSTEVREEFVRHDGYRLCTACYRRAYAHGTLPNPAPRNPPRQAIRWREEVLADYRILRARDYTRRECALRMGMTLTALDRALNRARAAGEQVAA